MQTGQNVSLAAGDTPTVAIALNVDAPPAFNPTGSTGTWTLSKASNSTGADILLTKSTSGACTFNQDADGLWWLWVPLAEADTSTLTPGAYFHTAHVVESGGGRYHVMTGTFTVTSVPDP